MKRAISIGIIAILALLGGMIAVRQPDIQLTINFPTIYFPTSEDILNPERGLYTQYTYDPDLSVGNTDPLTLVNLREDRNNKISLTFRLYYLSEFLPQDLVNDPPTHITEDFKDFLQSDFDSVRAAGQKIILRFAYQDEKGTFPDDISHNQDPGLDQVLMHIGDIGPILRANADVIAVVQAGFIGTWGEWFFVNPDFVELDANGNILDYKFSARKQVTDALLSYVPNSRSIQLRTPYYKNGMYGSGGRPERSDAIDFRSAFEGSALSRIGHHNDCFLAPFEDFGTYSSVDEVESKEREYLAEETAFLPMGGETCAYNAYRSCCDNAQLELAAYHWSYLKKDYNECVLATWGKTWPDPASREAALEDDSCGLSKYPSWPPDTCSGSCYEDIIRKLGYRLELLRGSYPDNLTAGEEMDISITLRNVGYAAPYNPRLVKLIFRNSRDQDIKYEVNLDTDPRLWLPEKDIVLRHSLCLPEDMIAGNYDLLLHLPDPEPSLTQDPKYSIKFANVGGAVSRELLWEPATGYNDLLKDVDIESGEIEKTCSSCEEEISSLPCEINLIARSSQEAGRRAEILDRNLETGFHSPYQDWQYVEIDLGCVKKLNRLRRHMEPSKPVNFSSPYVEHPDGNRGEQGEIFSYSLDRVVWTQVIESSSQGWERYRYYTSSGSAWQEVSYGWSNWLSLTNRPYARYIRFAWDANFDTLNEVELDYQER